MRGTKKVKTCPEGKTCPDDGPIRRIVSKKGNVYEVRLVHEAKRRHRKG